MRFLCVRRFDGFLVHACRVLRLGLQVGFYGMKQFKDPRAPLDARRRSGTPIPARRADAPAAQTRPAASPTPVQGLQTLLARFLIAHHADVHFRMAQVPRNLRARQRDEPQTRGSLKSRRIISLISCTNCSCTFSCRTLMDLIRFYRLFGSTVSGTFAVDLKYLHLDFAHVQQRVAFQRVQHLVQNAVDVLAVVGYEGDAQRCPPPRSRSSTSAIEMLNFCRVVSIRLLMICRLSFSDSVSCRCRTMVRVPMCIVSYGFTNYTNYHDSQKMQSVCSTVFAS